MSHGRRSPAAQVRHNARRKVRAVEVAATRVGLSSAVREILRQEPEEIGPDRSLYAKDPDRQAAIRAHAERVARRQS